MKNNNILLESELMEEDAKSFFKKLGQTAKKSASKANSDIIEARRNKKPSNMWSVAHIANDTALPSDMIAGALKAKRGSNTKETIRNGIKGLVHGIQRNAIRKGAIAAADAITHGTSRMLKASKLKKIRRERDANVKDGAKKAPVGKDISKIMKWNQRQALKKDK